MKKPIIFTTRRSNRNRNADLVQVAPDIERQARRLNRQQKRLEKNMGLDAVKTTLEGVARQKVIRYQDIKKIEPLTDTQEDFFDAWEDNAANAYVLYGSAGTGKTALSVYHGICDVLNPEIEQYNKLFIVRSGVAARDLGALPGNLEEKLEAYEAPYKGLFAELTGIPNAYERLKDMQKVEFLSSSYIRGITLKNCIIIVEEAQNFSWEELYSIATRVGQDTKIIFTGDTKQNDLHYKKSDVSGFIPFIDVTRTMIEFRTFRFTTEDIVRSNFCKAFLIACEKHGI